MVKGIWGIVKLQVCLQGFLVLIPLINQRLLGGLGRCSRLSCLGRLGCMLPAAGAGIHRVPALSLPALRRMSRRPMAALGGARWRAWGIAVVVVNTSHVVPEIPLARKSISGNGSFTSFVCAEVRLVAMTMHSMCFTFMA